MRRLLLALGLILVAGSAQATSCGVVPYTFSNGTVADANQVNSNFSSIFNCGNVLLAPRASPTFSGTATFSGTSSLVYNANTTTFGGLRAAQTSTGDLVASTPLGQFSGFPQYLMATSENISSSGAALSVAGFESDLNFTGGVANSGTLHVAMVASAKQSGTTTVGSNPGEGIMGLFALADGEAVQGGTPGNTRGKVWGLGVISGLYFNITNYQSVYGLEVDVLTRAGSSSDTRYGMFVVDYGSSVQGTNEDAAIAIAALTGSVGFKNGLILTRAGGSGQPISATGTFIGTSGGSFSFAKGIDLTSVTLSGNAWTGPLATSSIGNQGAFQSLPASGDAAFAGTAATAADRVRYQGTIPASGTWYWGVDGSDATKWKLSWNSSSFASPSVSVTTGGAVTLPVSLSLASLADSATAPTIASGGCTTGSAQSISSSNGSAAFAITLGGATCGSTITLTLPAAANKWHCTVDDITTPAGNEVHQTAAASATSVVLTNFVRTTGVAGNFTAADVLLVSCRGQ